jgi:Sel1 repeat
MMKKCWVAFLLLCFASSIQSIHSTHAEPSVTPIPQKSNSILPQAKRYPIPGQSDGVRLWTQFSPEEIKAFDKIFEWGETFDKAEVIKLRQKLQKVAEQGDVFGQYYLARTYDLYPYGLGKPNDAKVALRWYLKAASQNFAIAENFLYETYRYSLMGVPKDESKALSWLGRARKHKGGYLASKIALEFARIYGPQLDTVYRRIERIQPDRNQFKAYLEEAFKLDPNNQTAINWWGSELVEQNRYREAISVLSRSKNTGAWVKLADIYENGRGVQKNYAEAAKWYQKVAAVQVAQRKSNISKEENTDLRNEYIQNFDKNELFWHSQELYRMYCQKKITVEQMGEFYSPISYQELLKFQNNCSLPIGG